MEVSFYCFIDVFEGISYSWDLGKTGLNFYVESLEMELNWVHQIQDSEPSWEL